MSGRHRRRSTPPVVRAMRAAALAGVLALAWALFVPAGPPVAVPVASARLPVGGYMVPPSGNVPRLPVTAAAPTTTAEPPVSTESAVAVPVVPTTTPDESDVSTATTAAREPVVAPTPTPTPTRATPTPRAAVSPERGPTRTPTPTPTPDPPAPTREAAPAPAPTRTAESCPTSLDGTVRHVAQAGHHIARAVGFDDAIGGRAGRAGASDHPSGHALDFMTGREMGDRIAAYALDHRAALGITYVIWRQRINHGSGWEAMEDRGGATANHMDHVHVSFARSAPDTAPTC